jgi:putative transposase
MIVLEFKVKGKTTQYAAIDEAIRTAQFVRNKIVRFWMDNRGVGQKELYRHNTALRASIPGTHVNSLTFNHPFQLMVVKHLITIEGVGIK